MCSVSSKPHILLLLMACVQSSWPALQPNDVDRGNYDDLDHGNESLCTRTCRQGEPPRNCYYQFVLEPYTTLGGACEKCPEVEADCFRPQCVPADGFEKAILTINRRLPAPPIQVCKGDKIIVDVKNQMPGQSTSIHWHGIRQRDTPWMDGVPMVTQCPIMEGQTFRYSFLAESSGTYFYHSHDGLQKVDGVVGSLVVREPDEDNPVSSLYDTDLPSHTFVVQDWMHAYSNEVLPGLLQRILGQGPDSYLINGRGVHVNLTKCNSDEDSMNSNTTNSTNCVAEGETMNQNTSRSLYDLYGARKTPLASFRVREGLRHRFRIVSGTCLSCQFRITFQDHRPLVIATDDNPIEPVAVDSLVISAGERYDVVIEANRPVASYWIVVRGTGSCTGASQAAVLQYEGSPSTKPDLPHWQALIGYNTGYTLNPRNSPCNKASLARGVCVSQLRSVSPTPPAVRRSEPDLRITMAFNFHYFSTQELYESGTYHKYFVPVPSAKLSGLINNISNMVPPSPLLTQLSDVSPDMFCNTCEEEFCECTHLIKVPLGAVVEFVIADSSERSIASLNHPFHIHGHDFYVIEQGALKPSFQQGLQAVLSLNRTLGDFLPSKDTVMVPANGYAVVRILADNPGFWLYHCHFAYHLSAGMSAIFQVGEPANFKPPPPNFPKCNQYLPDVEGI